MKYRVKPLSLVSLEPAIVLSEDKQGLEVATPQLDFVGRPMTAILSLEDKSSGKVDDWALGVEDACQLSFSLLELLAANGHPVAQAACAAVADFCGGYDGEECNGSDEDEG